METKKNALEHPTEGTKMRLGQHRQSSSIPYTPGGGNLGGIEDAETLAQLSDSTTVRVKPSSNLDFRHNDNSFHVVAILVCELFEQQQDESSRRQTLTRILPEPSKFVQAVRYRKKQQPHTEIIQRLCELHLDEEDEYNPIYLLLRQQSVSTTNRNHEDPATPRPREEPTEEPSSANTHAFLAGSFSSKSDTGKMKQTEQQKLQMELDEAKHLLQTSVEPENQSFWKAHVEKLQAQTIPVVAAEEAPPKITEQPMVDVVAPADLPGNYRFEAEIEGVRFIATVPQEGVLLGETFTCVMQELDSVAIDIPVGGWKDGVCNICSFGCCHPTFWHAVFCPLILLSQIQTRLGLDFLGRPRFGNTHMSNRMLMWIIVSFWFTADAVLFTACNLKWSQGLELTVADWCAVAIVNVFMVGFVMFVTQSTRSFLREKYMIREERCFDLEDLCCAVTCLPCTVAQMARHTANYNTYEAVCCSKTGLPDGVKMDKEAHGGTKDGGYAV